MTKVCHVVAICIVIAVLAVGYIPESFAVSAVEADDAINNAELNLNSAFIAVAHANDAGANVTRFLEKLDLAVDLLSEAHLAFRAGDYEAASLTAVKCSNAVDGIVAEANQLTADAERKEANDLILTVAESGIGLVLLFFISVIFWDILKKRNFARVLEMRPEVEGTQ